MHCAVSQVSMSRMYEPEEFVRAGRRYTQEMEVRSIKYVFLVNDAYMSISCRLMHLTIGAATMRLKRWGPV